MAQIWSQYNRDTYSAPKRVLFRVTEPRITLNGSRVAVLGEENRRIPVVARLRMEEGARLADLQNLYVYSSQSNARIPLREVSRLSYGMQIEKMKCGDQFRELTNSCLLL